MVTARRSLTGHRTLADALVDGPNRGRIQVLVLSALTDRRSNWAPTPSSKAVALVLTTEIGIAQGARDLGVNPETLRNWVKQAKIDRGQGPVGALTTAERQEFTRLRRRVSNFLFFIPAAWRSFSNDQRKRLTRTNFRAYSPQTADDSRVRLDTSGRAHSSGSRD